MKFTSEISTRLSNVKCINKYVYKTQASSVETTSQSNTFIAFIDFLLMGNWSIFRVTGAWIYIL